MQRSHNLCAPARISPLLIFLGVLAALYFTREILIPLALAALLAFLLTPVVMRFERWRLGRVPSVLLAMIIASSVAGGLGWIAGNQLIDLLNQLPNYKANIQRKIEALHGPAGGGLAKARASVQQLTQELTSSEPAKAVPPPLPALGTKPARKQAVPTTSPDGKPVLVEVVQPPTTVLQTFAGMLGPLVAPIGTAVIVLVFAVVMLLKREDLRNRLLRLIGQARLNLATTAFDDVTSRVSRYLRLQFAVNATYGASVSAGLYFIGIPNPLVWGILAGVFRFVPYVGPLIGAGLPFVLALAFFSGWVQPLLCLALFLVLETTVAYVVEPALYGTHTGVSSMAILVAAVFWMTLWGPIGLILSTPLTVCLAVVGRYTPQFGFLHILLGDEPALSVAEQIYQRLLALDQPEAHALIDAFLKDHSTVELYDEVLIPALGMAEEDRHKGALDETREQFLFQSLEEFVVELGDLRSDEAHRASLERANGLESGAQSCVVCIPAADHADEITASMLAQVLEGAGHATVSVPLSGSPVDVLETLLKDADYVVCISALPPFALLKTRSLFKAVRERFPNVRIVLGIWSFSAVGVKAEERLGKAFAVEVATSLAQTIECVQASADSTLAPDPGTGADTPEAEACYDSS